MTLRAIIYARVSTDEQAERGYGLIYQVERCTERAQQRGYTLVHDPITEDYTGSTPIRPGMNMLLELIGSLRVDVVLIHRTDRLGRRGRVQDILESEITARGARTEYISAEYDHTTPQGRAMRRIQATFDELDYETIVQRLKTHKREAARRGSVMVTRPPYGYRVLKTKDADGRPINKLEIVDEEAAIVRMIFDWYLHGEGEHPPYSIVGIVRRLTEMRVPTRHDSAGFKRKYGPGVWNEHSLYVLLRSETYAGRWIYGRTKRVPIPGTDKARQVAGDPSEHLVISVPPIIDEATWQAAQERTAYNAANSKRNRKYTYLFSGMAQCAKCGKSYVGWTYRTTRTYRCRNESHTVQPCSMPIFKESDIHAVVWEWVKALVCNPEQITTALQERQEQASQTTKQLQSMIATCERLIASAQSEQQQVMALYRQKLLDAVRWHAEDTECQQRIDAHTQERDKLLAQLEQTAYTPDYVQNLQQACQQIAIGIDLFTPEEQRRTYELLNLKLRLAVEDDQKVVYATCAISLDAERITIASISSQSCTKERRRFPILAAGGRSSRSTA